MSLRKGGGSHHQANTASFYNVNNYKINEGYSDHSLNIENVTSDSTIPKMSSNRIDPSPHSVSSSTSAAVSEFDSLRREATKLERHLEDRVAKYQQLAQRLTTGDASAYTSSSTSAHHQTSTGRNRSSHHHLMDSSSTSNINNNNNTGNKNNKFLSLEEEESILSADISRTISAFTDLVNKRMSPTAERTGRSQHSLLVKRYREILFDCSTDFQKTSAAVLRRRDAMELFSGANNGLARGNGGEKDADMEHLLRERNTIGSTLRMTSGILNQAEEVRSDLRLQGSSLRNTMGVVGRIAANVPGMNHLIDMIRRKRSRDDMIVSGVIAACILFTLWYVFVA